MDGKLSLPPALRIRSVPLEQFTQANQMPPQGPAVSQVPPAELSCANAAATERAQRTGHAYLLSLIGDHSLLGSSDLAKAWGTTPQVLRQLAGSDQLVAIKVNRKLRYPVELIRFDSRSDALLVSRCLAKLSAIERVMFMMNEHPELGGRTVSEAFRAGQGLRVLALANRAAETGRAAQPAGARARSLRGLARRDHRILRARPLQCCAMCAQIVRI